MLPYGYVPATGILQFGYINSTIQGFKDSRIQQFKDSKIQGRAEGQRTKPGRVTYKYGDISSEGFKTNETPACDRKCALSRQGSPPLVPESLNG
jgi:hypothetical protein